MQTLTKTSDPQASLTFAPEIGDTRVVRLDRHNFEVQQYVVVDPKRGSRGKGGDPYPDWRGIGYFSNLGKACERALNMGARGEDVAELLRTVRRVEESLLACIRECSR